VARSTSASQPPRPPARLQPGYNPESSPGPVTGGSAAAGIVPVRQDLLTETEAQVDHEEGLPRKDRDQMRRAAESLARREQDQEKLSSLALTGFTGPEYEIFAGELAAYGYPVILAWLRRGMIFKYCADRGRPVRPTDTDRELLADSFEERLQLALETVAAALTFFRTHVLVGKRWSYDGGATLTTYFVGACLFAFPNVFRKWQGEQRRWRGGVNIEMLNCPDGSPTANHPGSDPADIAAARATVRDELNAMPPDTRAAAALILDDLTFAEAGALLGTTERGIEGRLYRYRSARGRARAAPGGLR
jgi:DNA-directed RNA polymerase specialized sigma24 family protein